MGAYMDIVNETKVALFDELLWQGDADLYWFNKKALTFFHTLAYACESIGDYMFNNGIVLGEDKIDFCGLLYITIMEKAKDFTTHYDYQVVEALDDIEVYCNYLDSQFSCTEEQANKFKAAMQELDMDMYDEDEVTLLKALYEEITGDEYTQDEVTSKVAINLLPKGETKHE